MTTIGQLFEGSCLCGRVRYRAVGPLGEMNHCHCADCRKSHGAAFASYIEMPRDRISFVQGEDNLEVYQAEAGTSRFFCRTCGSNIYCCSDKWEDFYLTGGTIDTPGDPPSQMHIFVRSRVPWFEIRDRYPQHETVP
jgi:hypothetical protein